MKVYITRNVLEEPQTVFLYTLKFFTLATPVLFLFQHTNIVSKCKMLNFRSCERKKNCLVVSL